MSTDPSDPVAIHDTMLERTRSAYLSNDFALFQKVFALPHVVDTFDGQRVIETVTEHRRMFEAMRAVFQDMGAIDMKHRTIAATFLDDAQIDTTFITEYILPAYRVSEEIVGNARLVRQSDGTWQVTRVHYATKMAVVSRALLRP